MAAFVATELVALGARIAAVEAAERAGRCLFTNAADEAAFGVVQLAETDQLAIRRAVIAQRNHFRKIMQQLKRALRAKGAVTARAFTAFCAEELQLDATQLIEAAGADSYDMEIFEYFTSAPVEQATVEKGRNELTEAWKRRASVNPGL